MLCVFSSQLMYVELNDVRGFHNATPLRSSLTPSKKVDVDRTIMPDGTIVTTVTTIQSRPKLDRKQGSVIGAFHQIYIIVIPNQANVK